MSVSAVSGDRKPPAEWVEDNERLTRLVACARAGDVAAFEAFYDSTARWLLRHVRRWVDDGQAEDVLAEAFLQAWNHLRDFDPARAPPRVWLAMIARSRALDHVRRQERFDRMQQMAPEEAPEATEDSDGPEHRLRAAQDQRFLHLALGSQSLSHDERMVLGLSFFCERTHRQIATETGWSLTRVRSLLSSAQAKLRADFDHREKRPLGPTAVR